MINKVLRVAEQYSENWFQKLDMRNWARWRGCSRKTGRSIIQSLFIRNDQWPATVYNS